MSVGAESRLRLGPSLPVSMKARETGSLRCTATPVNFILEVWVFLAKVSVDF